MNERLFSDTFCSICELIGALDLHHLDLAGGYTRLSLSDGWIVMLNGKRTPRWLLGEGWRVPLRLDPGHALVVLNQVPMGYVTPYAEPEWVGAEGTWAQFEAALDGAIGRAQGVG